MLLLYEALRDAGDVYSQTLIPFDAASEQWDAHLTALLVMHMKFLGFT